MLTPTCAWEQITSSWKAGLPSQHLRVIADMPASLGSGLDTLSRLITLIRVSLRHLPAVTLSRSQGWDTEIQRRSRQRLQKQSGKVRLNCGSTPSSSERKQGRSGSGTDFSAQARGIGGHFVLLSAPSKRDGMWFSQNTSKAIHMWQSMSTLPLCMMARRSIPETWRGDIEAFTLDELRIGLGHMKRGKSVGVDGTSVELLQGIVEVPGGEGHLLEYFNRVLTTQEIPSKWNEPLLIMIPKVAAPTLPKHLRPIAMSSAVGKLFARLLLNRALPKICPATYAQCAGKHRQTADYLYTVFRTLELCREWGHPLTMFKLDLEKAFDRLDRPALLHQLEARLGAGAELQCWRGLLRTTRACLQTPWGNSTVSMKRGIKQGSVESPSFFGHITEMVLAMAVASPRWQDHPRVLEGMDAEEMLFVDDGVLWTRSCCAMKSRVEELVGHLSNFGLSLNPQKCQLYVSKNVKDGDEIQVCDTVIKASKVMEVMGITMYVGITIYDLISPLTSRARAKFWELRHIFRCKSGMKGRVRVLQRVVGATALWCLCSFPPDAAAMSLLNATQLQLMVWLLRFSKKECESWVEYRQRAFRGARSALCNSGVERWSTLWLRRWWSFAGHRVRGMLAPHPVISSLYEDFRQVRGGRQKSRRRMASNTVSTTPGCPILKPR